MGVSFWGIVIYSIVFVSAYFLWLLQKYRNGGK